MNGEQLPKAGNHSPVKFLDLSSDFPGSHRGTTARLTGTLSPGLRPARIPPETHGPAPPEPSRLIFYPAASSPKGTRRPAHRNSFVPAPARPVPLPRPAAQRCRNHPGSFSTRRQLPEGQPPPGSPELTRPGSRPARIPPETRGPAPPEPSRLNFYPAPAPTGEPPSGSPELTRPGSRPARIPPETQDPAHRNHPGSLSIQRQPEGPARIALCLFPKGEIHPVQRDQSGEAGNPPSREIMSIKGYKTVTFYHKSAAFAREGKEFPAYFREPRSFWGDFGRFPGFFGLFPGDFGLFPSPSGRFGAVFFRERLTRKPDWAIIVADCFRGPAPDPLV